MKIAEPEGLDWQQGWDDWADLFQYMILNDKPLVERERHFDKLKSSDPTARSVARAARLSMAQFFAVLDRRDRIGGRRDSRAKPLPDAAV